MTEKEIIKALEVCWIKDEACGSKEDCPYYGLEKCIQNSVEDGIDLIKRQQERIERLKDNLDAVLAERATLDVDRVVAELEAEKYKGMEGLEPIKVAFNFGINKALDIVQGVSNDDR